MLDTNIVLDLLVFADESACALLPALASGGLCWLATAAMRDEFERVLGYPRIVPRLAQHGLDLPGVLGRFDRQVRLVEAPAKAGLTCSDPDDQKFIDLAVARRALLLSKDRAVLSMCRRLARVDVIARSAFQPADRPAHASHPTA